MTTSFGFSMEDVKNKIEQKQDKSLDRRICKCGHGARSHTSESNTPIHETLKATGRFACFTARMECPCQKFEPVMTTSDVRKFVCKTEGPAEAHALAKGALKGWETGATVEWIPGVLCDGCKGESLALYPIAIGPGGTESYTPTATNVLLCGTCRGKFTKPNV